MTSRFAGPPPCNKLHCEWLYKHAQQSEAEVAAAKQRAEELVERLRAVQQDASDKQRQVDGMATALAKAKQGAHDAAARASAGSGEVAALREALARHQAQLKAAVGDLRRKDAAIADLERSESPRSRNREQKATELARELAAAKRQVLILRDQAERSGGQAKRLGHCASVLLGRIVTTTPADDGPAAINMAASRLEQVDRWVQEAVQKQASHEAVVKELRETQARLREAEKQTALAEADRQVAIQEKNKAQTSMKRLREDLTSIKSEVEGHSAEAASKAERETQHKLAVTEKRALAAELKSKSLSEQLQAVGRESQVDTKRADGLAAQLQHANRRMARLQQVFETVMTAREEERKGEAAASAAREQAAVHRSQQLATALATKTNECTSLTSQLKENAAQLHNLEHVLPKFQAAAQQLEAERRARLSLEQRVKALSTELASVRRGDTGDALDALEASGGDRNGGGDASARVQQLSDELEALRAGAATKDAEIARLRDEAATESDARLRSLDALTVRMRTMQRRAEAAEGGQQALLSRVTLVSRRLGSTLGRLPLSPGLGNRRSTGGGSGGGSGGGGGGGGGSPKRGSPGRGRRGPRAPSSPINTGRSSDAGPDPQGGTAGGASDGGGVGAGGGTAAGHGGGHGSSAADACAELERRATRLDGWAQGLVSEAKSLRLQRLQLQAEVVRERKGRDELQKKLRATLRQAKEGEESAKRATAELEAIRPQVHDLRGSLEGLAATQSALREVQHRMALAEKKAIQLGYEVESLREQLARKDQGLAEQAAQLREKDIQAQLAQQRMASVQKVYEAVLSTYSDGGGGPGHPMLAAAMSTTHGSAEPTPKLPSGSGRLDSLGIMDGDLPPAVRRQVRELLTGSGGGSLGVSVNTVGASDPFLAPVTPTSGDVTPHSFLPPPTPGSQVNPTRARTSVRRSRNLRGAQRDAMTGSGRQRSTRSKSGGRGAGRVHAGRGPLPKLQKSGSFSPDPSSRARSGTDAARRSRNSRARSSGAAKRSRTKARK